MACYLITAVPACHARLTSPLRRVLTPFIRPSLFSQGSHISAWAQRRPNLSGFRAVHTQFVCPGSVKAHIPLSTLEAPRYLLVMKWYLWIMEANRKSGYPFVPPFSRYSNPLEHSHVGIRRGLEEGAAVSWNSGSAVPLRWLLCSF